jgi:hypothetical protein
MDEQPVLAASLGTASGRQPEHQRLGTSSEGRISA